ncbi:ParB/RepB/Spo0J family partition protein [Aquimarina algiphila]|uniref:ParB/RepB/Spo0J family partition protein n=1 Tax=Aquimarina algiphila TaxID=2047982 RepID=A0A554VIF7_9FLAO|nr:ParB/RepB/Spo0J family partition protein [Aquimarina algiphila]TSE07426.1 ParB/RepB/Spo0J family partition protein [Aquimarina algiphila]
MTVKTIPLSEIVSNHNNPRTTFNEESIEQLAQSIKQDGVLQNLIVKPVEGGYEVVVGGRRLRSLRLLLEQGEINSNFSVPVRIQDNQPDNDNLRIAVVENVQREQMHPLDEAEAFLKLTQEGVDLKEVAAQSGVSIYFMKRRLLLGNLIDDSKTAYREEKISLSAAEALAMGNAEDQKLLLERLNDGYVLNPHKIRNMLLCDKPSVSIALFDKEKYTGSITADLFEAEDNTYFDDVGQFNELQDEAVEKLMQDLENDPDVDWVGIERDDHFEHWRYDEAEEGENGGVMIHYRLDGNVEIYRGLVVRENTKTLDDSKPKERPEFTQKAYGYFANQKTILAQQAITKNIRKAKEIDVLQRINLFRDANIKTHQAIKSLSGEQKDSAECELLTQIEQDLMEFLGIELKDRWYVFDSWGVNRSAYYEAVKSLTDEQLDQLFVLLVAISFGKEVTTREETRDSLFYLFANDLDITPRDGWTPNEEFFKLHKKDQLLAIAEACGASIGKQLYKLKRKDLIAELVAYYANSNPLQNEAQQALKDSFCPRLMQFEAEASEA